MRASIGASDASAVAAGGAAIAVSGRGSVVAAQGNDGALLVGVVGKPRFTDLELEHQAREHGAAEALASAWRRDGERLLEQVMGPFSLAIIDATSARLLLAIDRIGQQPMTWLENDGTTTFATTARALVAANGSLELDPQAIASYVFHHMVPAPRGIYREQRKLQAAQMLQRAHARSATSFYWVPEFVEHGSFEELNEDLHAALDDAVKTQVEGEDQLGAFLSGGLDSSTVAGVLRRVRPDGVARTFSVGFQGADAEGYDELEYARISAKHFGTEQFEHVTTPAQVAELMPLIADSYDEPFGNSSAVAVHLCAKLAADHGVSLLLAGDGGDEVFGGNDRYARQLLFGMYDRLPAPLRGMVGAIAPRLPGTPMPLYKMPLHKLRRYVEQARVPLPDRLHSNNFLAMFPAEEVFEPGLLEQVDLNANFAQQREVFARPQQASDLNRMLYLDWQQTLADNDLRKVNVMAAAAGVQVSYPFLDERVIDVARRVPSKLKIRRGELRHFYRRAMRGFLADQTLSKSKHGFGLPFGVWLRSDERLSELADASLSSLAQRGLFKPAFLKQARSLHADDHASFFGELIWILVMFELWLASSTRSA